MIKAYDLGEFQLVDNSTKIKIDDLVKRAKNKLKEQLLLSDIQALGIKISLTTTKTRFSGQRFWFVCPRCFSRIGTLYKHPLRGILGCRYCLELKYKKQRFKGMEELKKLL